MLSSIEFTAQKAVDLKAKYESEYKCPCLITATIWNGKPLYRVWITDYVIPF